MSYKDMIEKAREAGVTSEEAMFVGISNVDKLLEIVKESNPKEYWKFMRKSHASMYGEHYDEDFAKYDVSNILYTDANGIDRTGEHWTVEEINNATRGKSFPSGTTEYDKYVAYNAMYADMCRKFNDDDILEICFLFFFADADAPEGKVWRYMCAMNK